MNRPWPLSGASLTALHIIGGVGRAYPASSPSFVQATLRYPPPLPLRKHAESQENDGQTGSPCLDKTVLAQGEGGHYKCFSAYEKWDLHKAGLACDMKTAQALLDSKRDVCIVLFGIKR